MKNLIFLLISIIGFTSCEKVIEIDLESSDPQIVIEGIVSNVSSNHIVRISKTTDYFNPGEIPMISGALVIVSDDLGQLDTFTEVSEGIYQSNYLLGIENRNYNLKVMIDDETFSATSYMPEITLIDSLEYTEIDMVEFIPVNDIGNFVVSCYFQDKIDLKNYYRIKIFNNGKESNSNGFHLINDLFFDGEEIEYGRLSADLDIGDTAEVELWSVDQFVYDYYETLDAILGSNRMNSSAPANPNSNIDGALGYFAAINIDREYIVIRK